MTSPPKIPDSDIAYHLDEELETLFHSDLQDLKLEPDESSQDDVLSGHLPQWLIGVIVVVVMLILLFFAMIVRSVVRNRKSKRTSSETALNSLHADDLESGKVGHGDESGLQVTSFTSLAADGDHSGCSQLPYPGADGDNSNNETDTLASRGCRNPLFVDDGEDVLSGNDKNKEKDRESNHFKTSFHNPDGGMNVETDDPNLGPEICRGQNHAHESESSKGTPSKHKNSKGKKSDSARQSMANTGKPETERSGTLDKKFEPKAPKFTPSRSNKRERTKSVGGSKELIKMDASGDKNKEKEKGSGSQGRDGEKSLHETVLNSIPEDNAGETTPEALRPDSGLSSQSDESKLQEDECGCSSDKDAEARAMLDAVLREDNTEDESLSQTSDIDDDTDEAKETEFAESGAVRSENQGDENATIPSNSGSSETRPSNSDGLGETFSEENISDSCGHKFSKFDNTGEDREHVTGKLESAFNWNVPGQTASMSLGSEGWSTQEVAHGRTTDAKGSLESGVSDVNNTTDPCDEHVENDNADRDEDVIRNDNKRNSTKL